MKSPRMLLCIAVFCACATSKHAAAPAKQTFNFDYKSPALAPMGSANLLVSIIRPSYASEFKNGSSDLFASFRKFMGNDIEELLIDKGFRVKGPYDSFDDMIFEDRKEADIALAVEIVPEFTAREGKWKTHIPLFQKSTVPGVVNTYYSYEGTVSLVGKINLIGYEPLSHQKIWVKSVPIPAVENINVSTAGDRLEGATLTNDYYNDPAVYNAIGNALLQQYAATFKKIDLQLDPREFETLRKQIKELKEKKGY